MGRMIMIKRGMQVALIVLVSTVCSQAYATHIQYASFADVSNTSIGAGDTWTHTFDLVNDEMFLWDIDSPTTTFGPTPDPSVNTDFFMGSYDPSEFLHYVTLRIDPNNVAGDDTSNYIALSVNDITIENWSNPIDLYDWGVPTDPVSDIYGIAANNYQIKVTLTGLDAIDGLKDKFNPIDILNVNVEGCFDSAAPVPEPATMLLMGLGLTGFAGVRRRMNKS